MILAYLYANNSCLVHYFLYFSKFQHRQSNCLEFCSKLTLVTQVYVFFAFAFVP